MLIESTVHLPVSLAFFQDVFHPPNTEAFLRIFFRWFHFVAGITWIGLLYFFNLVNVPVQKGLDADTKKKVNPDLLGRALWYFRWGCSVLVAAASLLTEEVKGKKTGDAATLAQLSLPEFAHLPGEEDGERLQCAKLVGEALLSAITRYSDSVRHEWEGDEALICTCFCVSERTIEAEIRRSGLTTVMEVTRACRAGGGCRSCWPLINDMLRSVPDFSL